MGELGFKELGRDKTVDFSIQQFSKLGALCVFFLQSRGASRGKFETWGSLKVSEKAEILEGTMFPRITEILEINIDVAKLRRLPKLKLVPKPSPKSADA